LAEGGGHAPRAPLRATRLSTPVAPLRDCCTFPGPSARLRSVVSGVTSRGSPIELRKVWRGLRVNPLISDLSPDYGFPASPRRPRRNHHAWLVGPTAPHATGYSTGSDSPRGCKPLAALPPYETPWPCGLPVSSVPARGRGLRRFCRVAGKDFRVGYLAGIEPAPFGSE
jgi:hypothetical protein